MSEPWTCPYCNHDCTVGESDIRVIVGTEFISKEYGYYLNNTSIIVCPNLKCRKKTISLWIFAWDAKRNRRGKVVHHWDLLPESEAKPFPDYIPKQLLDDYKEACLIKNKSPKASATLSRRCLQGMIRDFWNIKKGTLFNQIDELKGKVDTATWAAIDSVRLIGNIGAHMEKDVNLIIDVDPDEAGLLIWLIETLFKDWYISSHDREQRLQAITNMAKGKTAQMKKSD